MTPFAAALLVAGRANLLTWAVLAAALALFLLREPLLVLARQRWVWRDVRPESALAGRWVAALAAILTMLGVVLARAWGPLLTGAMGLGAASLTAFAVWMALRNRQRSVWFQAVSCGGLTFTAVAAARSVHDSFPLWAWVLWGLCWLQGVAGILVVHTRLDAMIARKTARVPAAISKAAWLAVSLLAAVAAALAATGSTLLAAAPALAAVAHGSELAAMNLDTRLTLVGLRAMAISMTYALIVALALR